MSITSANNGIHSLTARAYDAANNVETSSVISVTVNISTLDTTPPVTSITNPANNAKISRGKALIITASASDNVSVTKSRILC